MEIEKVGQPEPSYRLVKAETVVNWFDKDDFDPACYSIKDTLGDLQQNPEAGAIVNALLAQARKKRGDVAQSASNNPVLQKMMARMTLEGLIKQAAGAIPSDSVKEINARLQKIRKR